MFTFIIFVLYLQQIRKASQQPIVQGAPKSTYYYFHYKFKVDAQSQVNGSFSCSQIDRRMVLSMLRPSYHLICGIIHVKLVCYFYLLCVLLCICIIFVLYMFFFSDQLMDGFAKVEAPFCILVAWKNSFAVLYFHCICVVILIVFVF